MPEDNLALNQNQVPAQPPPPALSEERSASESPEQHETTPFVKSSPFKFLVVVLLLVGLGAASVFAYSQYKNTTSKKEDQPGTRSESGQPSVSEDNLTIVFVESTGLSENNDRVVFYDAKTQTKLKDIADFITPNRIYSLGPWSPSGRYLPIHVTALLNKQTGEDSGELSLYMYDSKQHVARKIYTGNESEGYEKTIIYSQVNLGSGWLDEEKFGYQYDRDIEKGELTIKYITRNGVMGETTMADTIKVKNNLLTVEYLGVSRTDKKIYINGKEVDVKPEGEIVGAIGNNIISLKKAEPKYDLGNLWEGEIDPALEAKFKEIESSDLSEEEKSQKMLELLQPEGSSMIYLTNVDTGRIEKTTPLSGKPWIVQSAQIHPIEPFLLIHETDRELLPEKHRILKISLQNPENKEVLVSEDTASGSSFAGSLLEEGVSFHITADGNWIVYYEDRDTQEPFNRNIVMVSLSTKEKRIICSAYCQWYKVYNPTQLTAGY